MTEDKFKEILSIRRIIVETELEIEKIQGCIDSNDNESHRIGVYFGNVGISGLHPTGDASYALAIAKNRVGELKVILAAHNKRYSNL